MTLVCDLHPFCQSQGCAADERDCQRVRDLRGGVENRPDLARHESVAYKLMLKGMTYDQLFEAWSHEYDAKRTEHAKLVAAEMGARIGQDEVIPL